MNANAATIAIKKNNLIPFHYQTDFKQAICKIKIYMMLICKVVMEINTNHLCPEKS